MERGIFLAKKKIAQDQFMLMQDNFLFAANQPHLKECQPAYLFPFPVSYQTHNATEYDHAISKCLVFFCNFRLLKIQWLQCSWHLFFQSTEVSGASLCSLVWLQSFWVGSSSSALHRSQVIAYTKLGGVSSWCLVSSLYLWNTCLNTNLSTR